MTTEQVGAPGAGGDHYARQLAYTEELEAYAPFFQGPWAKQQYDRTKGGPFYEPIFNLTMMWRCLSAAHALPSVMLKTMSSMTTNLLDALPVSLARSLDLIESQGDLMFLQKPLTSDQRQIHHNHLQSVRGKVLDGLTATKESIQPGKLWAEIVPINEINFSLFASAQSGYLGLFFSYEHFLTDCYRIAANKPGYRITRAEVFERDFDRVFGSTLCASCWKGDIEVARLIRNALVHNDGKIGVMLEPFRSALLTNDAGTYVLVLATQVLKLHELLKDRVTLLLDSLLACSTRCKGVSH